MKNTMKSLVHLYKELEEEQVGEEFTEKKTNITWGKMKNWREKC